MTIFDANSSTEKYLQKALLRKKLANSNAALPAFYKVQLSCGLLPTALCRLHRRFSSLLSPSFFPEAAKKIAIRIWKMATQSRQPIVMFSQFKITAVNISNAELQMLEALHSHDIWHVKYLKTQIWKPSSQVPHHQVIVIIPKQRFHVAFHGTRSVSERSIFKHNLNTATIPLVHTGNGNDFQFLMQQQLLQPAALHRLHLAPSDYKQLLQRHQLLEKQSARFPIREPYQCYKQIETEHKNSTKRLIPMCNAIGKPIIK